MNTPSFIQFIGLLNKLLFSWESVSKPIQTLQRLGSNAIDMGSSFSFENHDSSSLHSYYRVSPSFSFQNHDSSSLHSYYRVSQSYTWHSFFSIYVHYFSVSKQKFLRLLLLLLLLVPLLFRNFIFPQQQQRISTIIGCGLWNQETNIWNTHTQKPKKKEEATNSCGKAESSAMRCFDVISHQITSK